jgi:PPOX class probable F420-dependent enzyme
MTSTVETLGSAPYVLVTSFRKDGRAVRTPVWVVGDGDAIAIWTVRDSGKVKRIRRDGSVLVGPCDLRGRLTGDQVPGQATVLGTTDSARIKDLIRRKYGLSGRITLWGSKIRRGEEGTLGIRITPTV